MYGKGSDRVCLKKGEREQLEPGRGLNSNPILNASTDDVGVTGAMVESPSGNKGSYLGFCSSCWSAGVEKHGMLDGCPSLGLCLNGETCPLGSWCQRGYDEGRPTYQKHEFGMKRYSNSDVYEAWTRGVVVPANWRRLLMRGESMFKWARGWQYRRKLVGVGFSKFCGSEAEIPDENYTDEFLASEFWPTDDQKRLGEVIHKGHRSYQLVSILQLGIRHYLGQNVEPPKQELSALDFRYSATTQIRIPVEGFKHCTEMCTNFRWKDYCPAVFRHLQELDKINASDYMLSVCGNETLRELTSPGKSGSLLYFSQDDRFVIKTIRKSETKNPVDGFSAGLVDDKSVFEWSVTIIGPPDTLYDGGYFNAIMSFPANYPNSPPTVRFTSDMWHPNVYPDGRVCISILHAPGEDPNGYELASERWTPVHMVESIVLSIISMLSSPNDESPANIEAAKEWRERRDDFKKKVSRIVLLEMLPQYYNYIQKHTSTLLTKFYGLHLDKPSGGQKRMCIQFGVPLEHRNPVLHLPQGASMAAHNQPLLHPPATQLRSARQQLQPQI
ncbi:Ubiquitin-conjugating enzyme 13 [Asimina triloba]